MDAVPYNNGFYTLDITFYYRVVADVTVGNNNRPTTVYGLAVFSKRALLFGGEGNAKVFTSKGCACKRQNCSMPHAVVEVVDPMILASNVVETCNCCCVCPDLPELPECVGCWFDDELVLSGESRRLLITIGQFSIVRLERDTQLLIPCFDYCVPTKACSETGNVGGSESPCDMFGRIDGIVDGGPCGVGVESTIIDLTCTPPRLLRPGGLPLEALEAILGEVTVDKAVVSKLAEGEKPKAPGMAYRHYAPKAPVTVVSGDADRSAAYIRQHMTDHSGIICFHEYVDTFGDHIVHDLGHRDDKAEQARHVFDALRTFDDTDVREIWAQCPDGSGLGLAVENRLKKAAGFHVIEV